MFLHIYCCAPIGWQPAAAGRAASAIDWSAVDVTAATLAILALMAAGCFATLRRALALSVPERVLEPIVDPLRRHRLEQLLGRTDRLTTSATVLETGCSLLVAGSVLRVLGGPQPVSWPVIAETLALCVPVLWFTTDALARGLALRAGDGLLRSGLPTFELLQLPLDALAWLFELVRRGVLRLFGLRDDPESTRRLVAGLRNVIEDAEISGTLDATEKELISNVMEFRDVDVAAVMTPRTEIQAADVEQGVLAAAQKLAESGHSRVPVYEGTLDTIIGTVSARDLVAVMASGKLDSTELRAIVHTAYFVPETKRVSELMSELRREKIELAIVLDEYGGTAGLVTMRDILGEIVGDLPDEYDEDVPAPVRQLAGGAAEVDAMLHVSEVNEALDLDLPEEADYETLGGFVLATLGHFPQHGEHFTRGNAEFSVVEASDRRVLKVRVKKLAPSSAA